MVSCGKEMMVMEECKVKMICVVGVKSRELMYIYFFYVQAGPKRRT